MCPPSFTEALDALQLMPLSTKKSLSHWRKHAFLRPLIGEATQTIPKSTRVASRGFRWLHSVSCSVTCLETSHFRREINVLLKVYCNTAVGRAFLATFLATFLARLLTTLLTTLKPEARKSNPRKKKGRECTYTRNIPRNIQGNQRRVESVL